MKFILKPDNRNASDETLLDDLKKVAAALKKQSLTQSEYDKFGRFSSATIKNRFGWNNALEKAGLIITSYKSISNEELIEDLTRVANKIAPLKVTTYRYNEVGKYSSGVIEQRFGWNNALKKAGLEISILQNISNEELFENMEEVWIKLGKQPTIYECVKPFSKYSYDTYTKRFGNWRKALETFVEYINSDDDKNEEPILEEIVQQNEEGCKHITKRNPDNRLKLKVMWRDGNICRLCGVKLSVWEEGHFDHIIPWSKCGETVLENLQILCSKCNLIKGSLEFPKDKE
jgi:hypothetical protein